MFTRKWRITVYWPLFCCNNYSAVGHQFKFAFGVPKKDEGWYAENIGTPYIATKKFINPWSDQGRPFPEYYKAGGKMAMDSMNPYRNNAWGTSSAGQIPDPPPVDPEGRTWNQHYNRTDMYGPGSFTFLPGSWSINRPTLTLLYKLCNAGLGYVSGSNMGYQYFKYNGMKITLYPPVNQDYIFSWTGPMHFDDDIEWTKYWQPLDVMTAQRPYTIMRKTSDTNRIRRPKKIFIPSPTHFWGWHDWGKTSATWALNAFKVTLANFDNAFNCTAINTGPFSDTWNVHPNNSEPGKNKYAGSYSLPPWMWAGHNQWGGGNINPKTAEDNQQALNDDVGLRGFVNDLDYTISSGPFMPLLPPQGNQYNQMFAKCIFYFQLGTDSKSLRKNQFTDPEAIGGLKGTHSSYYPNLPGIPIPSQRTFENPEDPTEMLIRESDTDELGFLNQKGFTRLTGQSPRNYRKRTRFQDPTYNGNWWFNKEEEEREGSQSFEMASEETEEGLGTYVGHPTHTTERVLSRIKRIRGLLGRRASF